MTSSAELIERVRDVLKANGVARYGRYERENTYGALDALAELEARLEGKTTVPQHEVVDHAADYHKEYME